jgi:hypothetical protein
VRQLNKGAAAPLRGGKRARSLKTSMVKEVRPGEDRWLGASALNPA